MLVVHEQNIEIVWVLIVRNYPGEYYRVLQCVWLLLVMMVNLMNTFMHYRDENMEGRNGKKEMHWIQNPNSYNYTYVSSSKLLSSERGMNPSCTPLHFGHRHVVIHLKTSFFLIIPLVMPGQPPDTSCRRDALATETLANFCCCNSVLRQELCYLLLAAASYFQHRIRHPYIFTVSLLLATNWI